MPIDPRLHTVALLVLVAVAFVPLLDQFPVVREQRATAPQLTSSLGRSVPSGGVVLAFPYPRAHNDEPMLWQAEDEMSFRLVGGYALVPGAVGRGRYYVAETPDLSELSDLLTEPSAVAGVPLARVCRVLEAVVRASRGRCARSPHAYRSRPCSRDRFVVETAGSTDGEL